MATLQKRGKSWRAIIRSCTPTLSKTFATKAEAAAWAVAREAEILSDKSVGIPNKTFGQLLSRYMDEVTPNKRGAREETIRIQRFLRDPLSKINLRELDTSHFANWRDRRLKTVSAATVLRERNTLSNACKRAVEEWRWLPRHPMKGVVWPEKPAARDKRITSETLDRLRYTFGQNIDQITGRVGLAFEFAIETGMRAAEIARITKDSVMLSKRYCNVVDGKTKAASRDVPLSSRAIEILNMVNCNFNLTPQQIDVHFRKARDKAMVPDIHFHDSRHEAVTRLARKWNILELARAIGHKDLRQLQVYYNETAEELAKKLD